MSSGQGSAAVGAARDGGTGSDTAGPEPKRRKLLDAGGPIEDDETARQKMRNAYVYERGVASTLSECVGFDPDNVADVKDITNRPDENAITAMGYFAREGDLPMMRWLYVNGADTRDEGVGSFPMHGAAMLGRLEACKWLFDHGAAKDIKRKALEYSDSRPLRAALGFSGQRNLNLWTWFIMNGALCKDDDSGELDVEMIKYDLWADRSWLVLEWANDLHRARTSSLLFLSGALSRPQHAYSTRRSTSPMRLLSGNSGVLELIGDYVGFVRGREARIVRQLTEMLPDLI